MATRQTLEEFLKTLRAEQLGADGRFLGPQSGTNYQAEGMRPEDYFASRINDQRDTGRFQGYGDNMAPQMEDVGKVDANWVEGPKTNGMLGGLLGGIKDMVSDPKFLTALAAMGGISALGGAFSGAGAASGGATASGGAAAGGSAAGSAATPFSFATPEIMTAGTGLDLGAVGTTAAIPGEAAAAGFSGIGSGAAGSAGIGSGTALGGASAAGGGGIAGTIGSFIKDNPILAQLGGAAIGALTGKDTTTSTSSSRDPWAPAQPYLLDNLKTNANAQEHYREKPFSDLQQQQYGGLFNSLANSQANVPGMLANSNSFMQSKRGQMPAMQGLLSGTQAAPIDWSQYANIGRRG